MYDYEELMNKLSEMRSRFDAGFSPSDRSYIERLYASLLNKKVRRSGCSDCFRDAYLELYHYLKKEGKMPNRPNYVLKAGVVIHPKGTNEFYANTNIPDEVAEKHLAQFPDSISDFLAYPSDYIARVEARKNGEASVAEDNQELPAAFEATKKELEETKAALAAKEKEVEDVKAVLKDATKELEKTKAALENAGNGTGDDDGSLSMENETLKADLEAANAKIAALKAELETAKASSTTKKRTAKSAE